MSRTDFTCAPGVFHVILRIKGDQARAQLFHEILERVETSWPWKAALYSQSSQCEDCGGLVLRSPRVNPADIKAAARQACVKVKIIHFSPEEKCFTGDRKWCRTNWITQDVAHKLYRSKEWLETHLPRRKPILLPAPTDDLGVAAAAAASTPITEAGDGGEQSSPTRIIHLGVAPASCRCWCHERPIPQSANGQPRRHQGLYCCGKSFQPRELPVRPPIVDAAAAVVIPGVYDADGSIVVDPTATRVPHPLTERQLQDNVLDVEVEAAGDGAPWVN